MKGNAGESVWVDSGIKDGQTDMAIRQSSVVTPFMVLLSAMNQLGCRGGSSSGGSTGPPNPAPAIEAISERQPAGMAIIYSECGGNEFGEGSRVIPTAGDGTRYGDAIAAMLLGPSSGGLRLRLSDRLLFDHAGIARE